MSNTTEKRNRTIYMFDGGPGRQYIGQTVNLRKRLGTHRTEAKRGGDNALYRAVNKHPKGWSAFPLRVLMESSEPWTDAQTDAVESWCIHFHDTYHNGLNETKGGSGTTGIVFSPKHRARLSTSHLGKKFSPEHCTRISLAKRGKKRAPFSPEHRAKLSDARCGKSHSPESKAKMRASQQARRARERKSTATVSLEGM